MPDTQPSASALSDDAILNIAYKRTWLRAVSFKSDEIIDFVRAIEEALAALPAPVSDPMTDFWLDSHNDGDGWRDISCAQHGAFMRIVWKMEGDEHSPECEARAKWVIDALNTYSAPLQAVVAQPVDADSAAAQEFYACNPSAALFDFKARLAQPVDLESLRNDVSAIDTWYRGSPSYEHDAGWFKDRVVRLLDERIAAQSLQAKAGDKHD